MIKDDKNLSIYLHWPFCKSKCPYCDFFSQVKKSDNQDEIIASYLQELDKYFEFLANRNIKSVFFGGGTPSLIKPQNIEKIIKKIDDLWGLENNCEISLEANPNSNHKGMIKDLRNAGINRLSLGVQSLDEEELKFLGRTHSKQEALLIIEEVLKNFDNHSIDLIYALPNQSLKKWQNTLEQAGSLGLKHISLYQLTIEEGTLFYKRGIKELEEEKAVELYDYTEDKLKEYGYFKYEVSNYAKKGYEAKHNKVYWQGGDYIGIGKTAHGRIRHKGKIYAQEENMQLTELSSTERAEEEVIMGLRLVQGINKAEFYQVCGIEFDKFINNKLKQNFINQGLLVENKENIKATRKGFLVLNQIILGLCS